MCVALQQAGDQSDHIQPGVSHGGVQHPPGCLYDVSLWAERKEVSGEIHVSMLKLYQQFD